MRIFGGSGNEAHDAAALQHRPLSAGRKLVDELANVGQAHGPLGALIRKAKLLFAFSTFWMYIWFSQAMLIWYTNMPEEASWYAVRGFGNWGVLMWATVALMWVVPFLVLLSDKAKRNRTVLLRVSVVVLNGHWLDLYVTIVPAHSPEPRLTGWDLAIALGAFAAVGWAVTRRDTVEARLVLAPTV